MRNTPLICTALSLVLAGCGGGDSATDEIAKRPNSFGPGQNPLDNFSEGSTGDGNNNRGLDANQVRVTMEVPTGLTQSGEPTRRNLMIVQPDDVQVYEAFTNDRYRKYSATTAEDGSYVLTFDDGVPLGPELVIEARHGTIVLAAPAADSDRDIKVNPFSNYLVKRTIPRLSRYDLQQITACIESATCLNKYVWSTLADQVNDFEIDIPDNFNPVQATDFLDNRADFQSYVNSMVGLAVQPPDASENIRASSDDYNTIFLATELGQTFRESNAYGAGQWGIRTAAEEPLTPNDEAFLYPALSLNSTAALELGFTFLSTDIPYYRHALIHAFDNQSQESGYYSRPRENWDINSHATPLGPGTLTPPSDNGGSARLYAGRSLLQTVTDKDSATINGWTRNPYYFEAYTSLPPANQSEGPDRVVGGYFTAGKAIALENENGNLKRQDTLEDYYLSVLEVHLLRLKSSEEDFDLSKVTNNDYNIVLYSVGFANNEAPVFNSQYGTWSVGSAPALQGEPAITRTETGQPTTSVSPDPGVWNVSNRLSQLRNGPKFMGRLNLYKSDDGGFFGMPDLGQGAATPDGSFLAFNVEGSYLGNGLMLAVKKDSAALPAEGRYRIQGVIAGLSEASNTLYHINNGTLELTGNEATLTADREQQDEGEVFRVVHDIVENTVSGPRSDKFNESFSFQAQEGLIEDTDNSGAAINGVYTANGEQIILTVHREVNGEIQSGLLLASRIPDA